MTLADDLRAACGSPYDIGGMISSVTASIERAQRFVLTDDVARACCDLAYSRPSTLNAALPLVRMPYRKMWVENRGGLGKEYSGPGRPIPLRQGILLEAASESGQVGHMTLAWVHRNRDDPRELMPTVCPFCIYFDWRSEGDIRVGVRGAHGKLLEGVEQTMGESEWLSLIFKALEVRFHREHNYAYTMEAMKNTPTLTSYAGDPKEVEAIREGEKHLTIGVSGHAVIFLRTVIEGAARMKEYDSIRSLLDNWMADVAGEGPFAECFIAMLNTKNPCLDRTPIELSRLNKQRAKSGKRPLFDYTETRIALSRAQARYATKHGLTREQARGSDVRGHFKICKTGVYWWSDHWRGPRDRPMPRQHYEVLQ